MRPRLREHTWYTKSYMIEGKILSYFGNMREDEIESFDVVRWQNRLMAHRNERGEPYAPTYLRSVTTSSPPSSTTPRTTTVSRATPARRRYEAHSW